MSASLRERGEQELSEAGFVVEAKGYLLELEGLPSARVNDILVNERGQRALVTALREEHVEVLSLDAGNCDVGDRFGYAPNGIAFAEGDQLLGRVFHVLGDPIDNKGAFTEKNRQLDMEGIAPDMSARADMDSPLSTGMTAVDVLIPIAKGQRQLVVGPISSGKNVFLQGVVSNQHATGVIAVYALIGRPAAYVEEMIGRLLGSGGNPDAVILACYSDEPAPVVYLAPIVALQVAESYARKGKDVLVILDDLGTHAKYHREIALLSGQVPGRESYAGDLFYQQARLLERAGRFGKQLGGGSITILPVLETNIEDISNLISTNLVSATDGHLFFSPLLHAEGFFPALSPQESVTRVGRKTQSKLAKQLSIQSLALLAEYEHQRRYSQFGTQLSEETLHTLSHGEIMHVFLDQDPSMSVSLEAQVLSLALVFTSFFDGKDAAFARKNRAAIIAGVQEGKGGVEVDAVVTSARRGSISLEQFLKKLTPVLPYFSKLCQL